jgi:hypothetical protein
MCLNESYSKVFAGNFALQYVIMKFQEKQGIETEWDTSASGLCC